MQALVSMGTKHRWWSKKWEDEGNINLGICPILTSLKFCLLNWKKKYARENDIDAEDLTSYCVKVLAGIKHQIGQLPLSIDEEPHDLYKLRKVIRKTRKRFVVSYVDTFSSKFMFTCPKFYAQSLVKEFMPWKLDMSVNPNTDEQTYEETDEDSATIIQRHRAFLGGQIVDESTFDKNNTDEDEEKQIPH